MRRRYWLLRVMGSLKDALERCRGKLGEVGLTGRKLEAFGTRQSRHVLARNVEVVESNT